MDMLNIIMAMVGVIGTSIAIYQWAVLNESKKRRSELQFLLAGIHQLSLSKQMAWNNQMGLLPKPQDTKDISIIRLHARARDNFAEIASTITALENVIETDTSAIQNMLKKTIEGAKLNNELQNEGLKNPLLPKDQNIETLAEQ
jgi:protein subunit release factor A